MTDDRWIWIPNWDGPTGFQHYKDRDPLWIKCYTRLMSKDEFLMLTFHQRGVLFGVWLAYARSNRQLRHSTLTLTRQLSQRVLTRDLNALQNAGFIEVIDRFLLAERLQAASPEKRREEKTTGVVLEATGYPPTLVWQEGDKPPDLSFITGGTT